MELGVIIGFVAGLLFIFFSILLNANMDVSQVLRFLDAPSVMITIGGAIAATIIGHPLPKLITALKAIKNILKPAKVDPLHAIGNIIELANLARKEGILALEDASGSMNDNFLQKGVMLVVDGTDPELVRNILETEMAYIEGRHRDNQGVWEFMASQGPAWGMIGTLIGLIMMLQQMDDPSSIGPSMAVALITTLYGSLFANFIATPIANKMKIYSSDEILMKEVLIEGILSIQAGENPRIIEEKLKVFLAPALRNSGGEGESAEKAGDDE